MAITYGGGGTQYGINMDRCTMCGESVVKHRVPGISYDQKVIDMATRFAAALDKSVSRYKGYTGTEGEVVTPIMIATGRLKCQGPEINFYAISGMTVANLENAAQVQTVGKNTVVHRTFPDEIKYEPAQHILAFPSVLKGNKVPNIQGKWIEHGLMRALHIGTCAAQKLLGAMFRVRGLGSEHGTPLLNKNTSVSMCEMLWRDPGVKRKVSWDTNEPVKSCITCHQILPSMLCNVCDIC
jgi:hypothetical protein